MIEKRTKAFFAIIELAVLKGVLLFGQENLWRAMVGNWEVVVNASSKEGKRFEGLVVPGETMYVTFKGTPIGFLTQDGGVFASLGPATEDALLRAIARVQERLTT